MEKEIRNIMPENGAATNEEIVYTEGFCPYFQREKGHGVVYCECAKFRFPDKQSRRDIVYRFCAHPERYKQCAIKQAMDHYYERKYSRIEADVTYAEG